jgi:hypothetical protein
MAYLVADDISLALTIQYKTAYSLSHSVSLYHPIDHLMVSYFEGQPSLRFTIIRYTYFRLVVSCNFN